jgi:hypothetical protein
MIKSTTHSALLTIPYSVMSVVASQPRQWCASPRAPADDATLLFREFYLDEMPRTAIGNYIDMGLALTDPAIRKTTWGPRLHERDAEEPVRKAWDTISAKIIRNANMDILLNPATMRLTNLDLERAREAIFSLWRNMGEYGRRPTLFHILGNAFVECSRRVRYRGLSLREAQEKTLITITDMCTVAPPPMPWQREANASICGAPPITVMRTALGAAKSQPRQWRESSGAPAEDATSPLHIFYLDEMPRTAIDNYIEMGMALTDPAIKDIV